MAKRNAEGVYDSDPRSNPNAKLYKNLEHMEIIKRGLAVMDTTAASICMDNSIPIIVFNMDNHGNIMKVVLGEKIGTYIGGEK